MREPLVVRRPHSRRDQDREFRQARSERRAVAQELAKTLRVLAKLGAMDPDPERTGHSSTLAGDGLVGDPALRVVHVRAREIPYPHGISPNPLVMMVMRWL